MSPAAHTCAWPRTRHRSSTSRNPPPPGRMFKVSRPSPSVRGERPVATTSRVAVSRVPSFRKTAASAPAMDSDAELLELSHPVGVVEAVGDLVASGRRDVIRDSSIVQAQRMAYRAGRLGHRDLMANFRRVKHRLAGHAGEVGTLAANESFLGDRH